MLRDPPSSTTAFNQLPIELNRMILQCLEADKDIANFSLICKQTFNAVNGDRFSFWRARFREKYAYTPASRNKDLKLKYQRRAKYLKGAVGLSFRLGKSKLERKVVSILQELIIESFQGGHGYDDEGRPRCPNQEALLRFILNSKHFLSIKALPVPTQESEESVDKRNALAAVRIMCAQLLLQDVGTTYDILPFDDCQKVIYSHISSQRMFAGVSDLQVNMDWILHCLSFFRHHMIREETGSLYPAMMDFLTSELPSAWQGPLGTEASSMSRHWKGTYAFLDPDELTHIRKKSKRSSDECYLDKNVELGASSIQELQLHFVQADELPWPQYYEDRLHSLRETMAPRTRAQHRAPKQASTDPVPIRIVGDGNDQGDAFFACGWLNPLAPQGGIPGWQRVTLMKHFEDYDQAESDDLWAYEGVVIPGGRIMIGRWWYATGDMDDQVYGYNSGPFILWAVEGDAELDTDFETESGHGETNGA